MAGLSPGPGQPGQQPVADSAPGEEVPSAQAELHVVMIPFGDSPDDDPERQEIQAAGDLVGRLTTLMRRARFGVRARMTVPAANAGEMLALYNSVTWGLTAVITLAITVAAGVPITAIIVIIVLELVGFVGFLFLRRRRHTR
jgi:hypothetical protein